MAKIIVSTGRGGTGKTTFVAIAARFLDSPPLLIDADPDQSLAAMLGLSLDPETVPTISDVLYSLQDTKRHQELGAMPLAEKIQYLLQASCLYESRHFDMITLGVKWTRGCYCHPTDILRAVLPELARAYAYCMIDAPAGLEHVNRRIVSNVDDIFAIVGPSAKSLENTRRLQEISENVGLSYRNLYLVGNHRFPEGREESLKGFDGATYVGKIGDDNSVAEYDWQGRSLLDLPQDSPACTSVRNVLQAAGYRLKQDS